MQELAGKSFIRNPHYNLVRLGICENGVYKVDSTSPKLLAFWKFKEIKDSSYSGFSFTLVSILLVVSCDSHVICGVDIYSNSEEGSQIIACVQMMVKPFVRTWKTSRKTQRKH